MQKTGHSVGQHTELLMPTGCTPRVIKQKPEQSGVYRVAPAPKNNNVMPTVSYCVYLKYMAIVEKILQLLFPNNIFSSQLYIIH